MNMEELKELKICDIPSLIEDLKKIDDDFLNEMIKKGFTLPLTTDQITKDILSDDHYLFKFVNENRIIGYCQLTRIELKSKMASIGRVVIKEDFRNKGYSSKMIKKLMNYAKNELNIKTLYLRVFDFNNPDFKSYKNLGFKEANSEKFYYTEVDKTWNCITMKKNLD